MSRTVLRRFGASLLLVYVVLTLTFFVIHLAPGEPGAFFVDTRLSEDTRDAARTRLGLDQPLHRQYLLWLTATLRGDWGTSFTSGRPALAVVLEQLPHTFILVLAASAVEYGLGLPLGLYAARRADGAGDHAIRTVSLALYSMPSFWLGLLLIEWFAVRWTLFPPGQMTSVGADALPWGARLRDLLHHLALPALTLGLIRCGAVVRFTRNGLLEAMGQDYIRTARAKGIGERRILWVHALPNALGPLVQRLGVALPIMLSGSLVIESVFSWPGIGYTAYLAVLQRDYPVVLASTALLAILVVFGSLLADLLHAWIDPRVRGALGVDRA